MGEAITGRLVCAPNAKNPRDLDIEINYTLKGGKGTWEGSQEYKLR